MKELFQKLSNLFSFGKEARLIHQGEAPKEAPAQAEEAAEKTTETPKTPEEGVEKTTAKAPEKVKAGEKGLTELEKKTEEMGPFEPLDLSEEGGKEMAFTEEEVAEMMEEAEAEETEEEALTAAAHKAGVEREGGVAEELGPFEPLDLSEEEEKEAVAAKPTREPR